MASSVGEPQAPSDGGGVIPPPDYEQREHAQFLKRALKQAPVLKDNAQRGHLPVFALDYVFRDTKSAAADDGEGKTKKQYAVCSCRSFWDVIYQPTSASTSATPPRYWYELLLLGVPCHLYVDAEAHGAEIDTEARREALCALLVARLCEFLRATLGALVPIEPLEVVQLDSSVLGRKVSRHLVLRMRGGALMFAGNEHVGAVMRRFDRWMFQTHPGELRVDGEHARDAEPRPDRPARCAFFDLTVYTRNRLIRLVGSAKLTASAPRYMHELGAAAAMPATYEAFARTLIQRPACAAGALRVVRVTEYTGAAADYTSKTWEHMRDLTDEFTPENFARRHRRPAKPVRDVPLEALECAPHESWARDHAHDATAARGITGRATPAAHPDDADARPAKARRGAARPASTLLLDAERGSSSGASADEDAAVAAATAELGQAVVSMVADAVGDGQVHEYTINARTSTVLVSSQSHECAIRGGAHRGNHVYYVVQLNRRHACYMHYYQACHDDGCYVDLPRAYRPVPERWRGAIERALEVRASTRGVSLDALLGWV